MINSLDLKIDSNKKTKHLNKTELEDLNMEHERIHAAAILAEMGAAIFEKIQGEL